MGELREEYVARALVRNSMATLSDAEINEFAERYCTGSPRHLIQACREHLDPEEERALLALRAGPVMQFYKRDGKLAILSITGAFADLSEYAGEIMLRVGRDIIKYGTEAISAADAADALQGLGIPAKAAAEAVIGPDGALEKVDQTVSWAIAGRMAAPLLRSAVTKVLPKLAKGANPWVALAATIGGAVGGYFMDRYEEEQRRKALPQNPAY